MSRACVWEVGSYWIAVIMCLFLKAHCRCSGVGINDSECPIRRSCKTGLETNRWVLEICDLLLRPSINILLLDLIVLSPRLSCMSAKLFCVQWRILYLRSLNWLLMDSTYQEW